MIFLTLTILLILTFMVSCNGELKYSGAMMFIATLLCTTILMITGHIN